MIALLAANWRKNLNMLAYGLVGLTLLLSVVHVKMTDVGSVVGLSRFLLLMVTGLLTAAVIKPQLIDGFFKGVFVNNPLFVKIKELKTVSFIDQMRLDEFKRLARANSALFQVNDWHKRGTWSPMEHALDAKQAQLVLALLECGSSPFERVDLGKVTPLEWAANDGNKEIAAVVAQFMRKMPKELLERHNLSRATIAIALGDLEMLKQCSKEELDRKDTLGRTAINAAIDLEASKAIVDHIVNQGVSLNHPIEIKSDKKSFKINVAQHAASVAGQTQDESALLAILQSGRAKLAYDQSAADAVTLAICNGLIKSVKAVEATYDWSTIHGGRSALDQAKVSKSLPMVELVTKNMQARGLIQGGPQGSAPQASAQPKAVSAANMVANRTVDLDEISMKVEMSLAGLVEMESFSSELAKSFHDFSTRKPKQSHGIVIWGDASVGKSSIGKRLSGIMDAQGFPGLDIPEMPVEYHSLADSAKGVPEIIENLPAGAIVFFDEIDKFFDPNSNLVSKQDAAKIITQIITNWDRKPIFWIFAGTFHALRGKSNLTSKMLLNLLGSELNSRLEFAPWKISPWTVEKIMAAASHHIEKTFGDAFDDQAAVLICNKALEAEGGFREFEKHARALYRVAQKANAAKPFVSIELAQMYYHELEGTNS